MRQRRVDACGGRPVIEQQIPVAHHPGYAWRILRRLSRSCSARPQGLDQYAIADHPDLRAARVMPLRSGRRADRRLLVSTNLKLLITMRN